MPLIGYQKVQSSINNTDAHKANRNNKHLSKNIPLDSITVNDQVRTDFDEDSIKELSQSIEQHGLINPITVMEDPDDPNKVTLISGERRYRAYSLLNHITIPAIIVPYSDDKEELVAKQLIENIQRVDLSVLETAMSINELRENGLSAEQISNSLGKSKRSIYRFIQIANLAPRTLQIIKENNYSINKIEQLYLNKKESTPPQPDKAPIKNSKNIFKLNITNFKSKNDCEHALKELEYLSNKIRILMLEKFNENKQ